MADSYGGGRGSSARVTLKRKVGVFEASQSPLGVGRSRAMHGSKRSKVSALSTGSSQEEPHEEFVGSPVFRKKLSIEIPRDNGAITMCNTSSQHTLNKQRILREVSSSLLSLLLDVVMCGCTFLGCAGVNRCVVGFSVRGGVINFRLNHTPRA
jgi:hypothetical protein